MNPYVSYSRPPPAHSGGYYSSYRSATPSPGASPSHAHHGYYYSPNPTRPSTARPAPRTHHRYSSTGHAWTKYDNDTVESQNTPPRGTFSPRYHSSGYYATAAANVPSYAYEREDLGSSPHYNDTPPRHTRGVSTSTPRRSQTARPTTLPKKPPRTASATEADAIKHRIPKGYSLKNWDPTEEPIILLGSVFDANSLGKWIYDWTVFLHTPTAPIADMAGELWLLLISLAGKTKRAEECVPRIRTEYNRAIVEDFIEGTERLNDRLQKILKACEAPMLRVCRTVKGVPQLGKAAGMEFVNSLFGRDQQLTATEQFMSSMRLWHHRFDANCAEILSRPEI
ncbi:hypothetical protein K3495_g1855 [Podosphaera aphanis]|nr:hypothetical protein K3495_g1855 [Podosphaera aphanis]